MSTATAPPPNPTSNLQPVFLSSPSGPSNQQSSTGQTIPISPNSNPSDSSPAPSLSSSPPSQPPTESDQDLDQVSSPPLNDSKKLIRLRKGTRFEDTYPSIFSTDGEEPDPASLLATLESPFQVQEYIAQIVRADPHAVQRIVRLPTRGNNSLVQREVWIYEQLRRLAHDLGHPLVSMLQTDCGRTECPEMKAGEWLYLCAAHATANENECCAIDYIVHTLDGATALLNSARYFPSRLQIPSSSIKHFTSIARRLYRILAHAWFHHRELFDQCETETSLYARFLALTDQFDLIAEDLLVIPRDKPQNDQSNEETINDEFSGTLSQRMRVPLPDDEDDELEELE